MLRSTDVGFNSSKSEEEYGLFPSQKNQTFAYLLYFKCFQQDDGLFHPVSWRVGIISWCVKDRRRKPANLT